MQLTFEEAVKEVCALLLKDRNIPDLKAKENSRYREAIITRISELSVPGMSEYGVVCEIQTQVRKINAPEQYLPGDKQFFDEVFEVFVGQIYSQVARLTASPEGTRGFHA